MWCIGAQRLGGGGVSAAVDGVGGGDGWVRTRMYRKTREELLKDRDSRGVRNVVARRDAELDPYVSGFHGRRHPHVHRGGVSIRGYG
jgi:hypothetical protein